MAGGSAVGASRWSLHGGSLSTDTDMSSPQSNFHEPKLLKCLAHKSNLATKIASVRRPVLEPMLRSPCWSELR